MIVVYTILAIVVFFTITDICQVALIKKNPEPQIRYPTKEEPEQPEQKEDPEIVYTTDNRCIYCQEIIPEGSMVCPICWEKNHKEEG